MIEISWSFSELIFLWSNYHGLLLLFALTTQSNSLGKMKWLKNTAAFSLSRIPTKFSDLPNFYLAFSNGLDVLTNENFTLEVRKLMGTSLTIYQRAVFLVIANVRGKFQIFRHKIQNQASWLVASYIKTGTLDQYDRGPSLKHDC